MDAKASVFAALLFGLLAAVSFVSALYRNFPVGNWLSYRLDKRRKMKRVEAYIPHMTEREKNIIGYLLKNNQKMFTGAADGGYAVTLISRGIVVRAMRSGQQASVFNVPYMIPDDIWDVLIRHKDKITYKPRMMGGVEVHPWREPVV